MSLHLAATVLLSIACMSMAWSLIQLRRRVEFLERLDSIVLDELRGNIRKASK